MGVHELNPPLAAISTMKRTLGDGWWGDKFRITKIMPPDAFLAELEDGTRWIVSAYRAGEKYEHGA